MSKHTKGPWSKNSNYEIGPLSQERDQSYGMVIPVAYACDENREANAARIVACVNACEDIADPRVVPELLDAVKRIHDRQNCVCKLNPYVGRPVPCETCVLSALIARATGGEHV